MVYSILQIILLRCLNVMYTCINPSKNITEKGSGMSVPVKIEELVAQVSMPILYEAFQQKWAITWNEYAAIDRELDQYRGIEFEDRKEEVKEIIKRKQDKFFELLPSLQWCTARAKMSELAMKDFEQFVDLIQTSGGKEVPRESRFESGAQA